MENGEKNKTPENCIIFRDLCALFELGENRIFRQLWSRCRVSDKILIKDEKTGEAYLFVELVKVVKNLSLGLNEHRVLLHFLSGGHLSGKGRVKTL